MTKNLVIYEKTLSMIEYGAIAVQQFPKHEKFVLAAMVRQKARHRGKEPGHAAIDGCYWYSTRHDCGEGRYNPDCFRGVFFNTGVENRGSSRAGDCLSILCCRSC